MVKDEPSESEAAFVCASRTWVSVDVGVCVAAVLVVRAVEDNKSAWVTLLSSTVIGVAVAVDCGELGVCVREA